MRRLQITATKEQGNAEKAGLEKGDFLISYNGTPITSNTDLTSAIKLANSSEKKSITIVITRNSATITKEVSCGPLGISSQVVGEQEQNKGLKACKDCGKEISTNADKCPNCGGATKKRLGCLGIFGVIILLFLVIGNLDTSKKTNEKKDRRLSILRNEFVKFSRANEHIEFVDIFKTIENSYVARLRVDSSFDLSSDTNSREKNLELTKKWSSLVCTYDLISLKRKLGINFLSVRQEDSEGEDHSIALCD